MYATRFVVAKRQSMATTPSARPPRITRTWPRSPPIPGITHCLPSMSATCTSGPFTATSAARASTRTPMYTTPPLAPITCRGTSTISHGCSNRSTIRTTTSGRWEMCRRWRSTSGCTATPRLWHAQQLESGLVRDTHQGHGNRTVQGHGRLDARYLVGWAVVAGQSSVDRFA